MRKIKIIFATLVAASIVFGSVIVVNADCGKYGKITKIRIEGTNAAPLAFVYIRPETSSPNASYHYWYRVNRGGIINVLAAAFAGNDTVYIKGSAATCPTTGGSRYGGYATQAYVYKTR